MAQVRKLPEVLDDGNSILWDRVYTAHSETDKVINGGRCFGADSTIFRLVLCISVQSEGMGLLKIIRKTKKRERELRILMLGLDNAGKTTILMSYCGYEGPFLHYELLS